MQPTPTPTVTINLPPISNSSSEREQIPVVENLQSSTAATSTASLLPVVNSAVSTGSISSNISTAMKRPPSDNGSTTTTSGLSEYPDLDSSGGDPKRKKMRKETKVDSSSVEKESNASVSTASEESSKSKHASDTLVRTTVSITETNSSTASSSMANSSTSGSINGNGIPKVPPIKIVLPPHHHSHSHGNSNVGNSGNSGISGSTVKSGENETGGNQHGHSSPAFPYVVSSTTSDSVSTPSKSSGSSRSFSSNTANTLSSTAPDSAKEGKNNSNSSSGAIGSNLAGSSFATSILHSTASVTTTSTNLSPSISSANSQEISSTVSPLGVPSITSTRNTISVQSAGSNATTVSSTSSSSRSLAVSVVLTSDTITPITTVASSNFEKAVASNIKESTATTASSSTNAIPSKDSHHGKGSAAVSSTPTAQNESSGSNTGGVEKDSRDGKSAHCEEKEVVKEKKKSHRVTRSSNRIAASGLSSTSHPHANVMAKDVANSPNSSPKNCNCPSSGQLDAGNETASSNAQENDGVEKMDTSEPAELHPQKRKIKPKELPTAASAYSSSTSGETTETVQNPTTATVKHDQPILNCFEMYLNIMKQIARRRRNLFPVQPKPPQGFNDYLMNRGTYILASSYPNSRHALLNPPENLSTAMKQTFIEQEKERRKLRLQHIVEKEKLVLSVEQEILRVHGRAARAQSNQTLPFSVCTILKDQEVYNLLSPEQEEKDKNARSRYNGRLFLSWLQEVDDKWDKIKESMLLRHHNEAESLHAVQKMGYEWKLKEVGLCEPKATPVIEEFHVPMVHVSDDFDLLPA